MSVTQSRKNGTDLDEIWYLGMKVLYKKASLTVLVGSYFLPRQNNEVKILVG